MFDAQVRFLREHFRTRPGETDLPTFPLFALFNPALGMTAVIPEMDFTRPGSVDPEAILEPLRRWNIEQMFGSPALLDRVGRWGAARGVKLPALKRVITAGAPVPPAVLERFAKLLPPDARIHTPYGATEALPVSSITHQEVLEETAALSAEGRGTCVGRPLPGVRVEVVRIDDGPLPDWSESLRVPVGAVGEFVVRGPQVTREYFGRPEADALAKIRWPDGTLGHRMGDLGWLDERGRLWFCGRKSHRVRTPAGVLFTIPCEAVFNRHPKVRRTALVGVGEPEGQRPVLCVELEEGARPSDALEEELLALGARHEHTRAVRDVLFHPSCPVDIRHNAKIFREKLAVWAAREL
jgi:acyl-CoA synthetase (AMP-forming)/AMP-acid ligase II